MDFLNVLWFEKKEKPVLMMLLSENLFAVETSLHVKAAFMRLE